MSDHENHYRRYGDYSDMPRSIAWFLISVKEVGLPAVVIGALLYICFISFDKMTQALNAVTVIMVKLDTNDHIIMDEQKEIMQRIK